MDKNKNIVWIILFLIMIVLIVAIGNDFLPCAYSSDGMVVDKGYSPPQRIDNQYVLDGQWWIDVYSEEEMRTGRIYLNRRLWAKTHVGDEWSHGLEEY